MLVKLYVHLVEEHVMLLFHSYSHFIYVLSCSKYLRHNMLFGCSVHFLSSVLFVNWHFETRADTRTLCPAHLLAHCCDRAEGWGAAESPRMILPCRLFLLPRQCLQTKLPVNSLVHGLSVLEFYILKILIFISTQI